MWVPMPVSSCWRRRHTEIELVPGSWCAGPSLACLSALRRVLCRGGAVSAANYVPHTMRAGTREGRSPSSSLLAPPKGVWHRVACKMYTIQTSVNKNTLH